MQEEEDSIRDSLLMQPASSTGRQAASPPVRQTDAAAGRSQTEVGTSETL